MWPFKSKTRKAADAVIKELDAALLIVHTKRFFDDAGRSPEVQAELVSLNSWLGSQGHDTTEAVALVDVLDRVRLLAASGRVDRVAARVNAAADSPSKAVIAAAIHLVMTADAAPSETRAQQITARTEDLINQLNSEATHSPHV